MLDSDLVLCNTCGAQFGPGASPTNCKICDDPRQFVASGGQAWTTLAELQKEHKNKWEQAPNDPHVWFIETTPKFAVGERCCLIQTPHGNILWDLIALIDDETIDFIKSKGGLKAMVISHPHYYTTYATWSKIFECPVYTSVKDAEWFSRDRSEAFSHKYIEGDDESKTTVEILPGVTMIRAGGHFPGSLLLHWENRLFIADTIVTVPSGYSPHPRPPGQTTYSFLWSIVNMIPLAPDEIHNIWRAAKPYKFDTTYGAFYGMNITDPQLKSRLLESMQIVVKTGGHPTHALLKESVD